MCLFQLSRTILKNTKMSHCYGEAGLLAAPILRMEQYLKFFISLLIERVIPKKQMHQRADLSWPQKFLDCEVYSKGRLLTVVGRFKGFKEGRIDGMPYKFPLIEAQATYLWKNRWYRDYYWRPSIWFWYGSSPWYFDYGYPAWW